MGIRPTPIGDSEATPIFQIAENALFKHIAPRIVVAVGANFSINRLPKFRRRNEEHLVGKTGIGDVKIPRRPLRLFFRLFVVIIPSEVSYLAKRVFFHEPERLPNPRDRSIESDVPRQVEQIGALRRRDGGERRERIVIDPVIGEARPREAERSEHGLFSDYVAGQDPCIDERLGGGLYSG